MINHKLITTMLLSPDPKDVAKACAYLALYGIDGKALKQKLEAMT